MNKKTEITWSLMHPTPLNVEYMRRVISEIPNYPQVDSFEICAACHSLLGGLDGLVLYEDYPAVASSLDKEGILANRAKLREILQLAHAVNRPVYYWHREVTVWPAMLKAVPDLMDPNGEFDLLGAAFEKLLRYKLAKAFEAVPELDGIVLTLTEADFSAIHNSTPEVYPPEKVVEKIVRIFAEEHEKRGKRFILRSFGSIAKDYEDILAGAKLASKEFSFEVETKITPFDFNPFLPENPFLRRLDNLTLGAECDSLGEFLGAGYLPADNVDNIVRYVRGGQKKGVNRYAIRLDRVGNSLFDTYPINLYAYERAILDPAATAESIRREYAQKNYPASCREALIAMDRTGIDVITRVQYIDHQLIFHQFPLHADLKIVKAGGIFGVFREGSDLKNLDGIWAILTDRPTPGRKRIVAEKEEALAMVNAVLAKLEELKPLLPETEYKRRFRLWNNLLVASRSLLAFCRMVCAYFDDMESGAADAPRFRAAREALNAELGSMLTNRSASARTRRREFVNGMDHDSFKVVGDDLDEVYLAPLMGMGDLLEEEFSAEFAARKEAASIPGVREFLIPGGITDDGRFRRFMFGSHAALKGGRPCRIIGNQVFPNGTIECTLSGSAKAGRLLLKGEGEAALWINGAKQRIKLDGGVEIPLAPAEKYALKFAKVGAVYPVIFLIAEAE